MRKRDMVLLKSKREGMSEPDILQGDILRNLGEIEGGTTEF